MSDFGELCSIFNTGVYNTLYLGQLTTSMYYTSTTLTLNVLGYPGLPTTYPSSLKLGRTVVVTSWWTRRNATNDNSTTLHLTIGRRTGSGTAAASVFGSATFSAGITAHPDILGMIRAGYLTTSMTLNTADVLNISNSLGDDDLPKIEIWVQYREK